MLLPSLFGSEEGAQDAPTPRRVPGHCRSRISYGVKRVVVTGATGFVGANLTRGLLRDGHDVSVFVRPGCPTWRIRDISDHVRVFEVDLLDAAGVADAVRRVRPEWVFNLAAHGAYWWQTDMRTMLLTNVLGTVNLVEAATATGFDAFVHTGSSSEYGAKDHSPLESEALEPNSHYAVTKASATMYCRYTGQATGLPLRVLRLYSVFGPWEDPSRLMPTLVRCGLQGHLPSLVSPATARDYIYVDDVVRACLAAAASPGQEPGVIYNVGTGRQTTLRQVVELARTEFSISAEPDWGSMPPRIWDTDVWVADATRIEACLGWRPQTTLEDGFRCLVGWTRGHPEAGERHAVTTES